MSKTFSLVCHATKQRLWIGQGYDTMDVLYTTSHRLEKLHEFFNATMGKPLVLLCDEQSSIDVLDYEEFEEPEDKEE